MRRHWWMKGIAFLVLAPAFVAAVSLVVMLLWNALVPSLFSGPVLGFWQAVGLLHDMDYERYPNQEQSATEGHPFIGVACLRENGWNEEICHAILSHADYSGVTRETPLERTLYAVDELSGFVMAVARVRPGHGQTPNVEAQLNTPSPRSQSS